MAQLAARRSHNPKVASSILAGSNFFIFEKEFPKKNFVKPKDSPTGIRTRVVWVKTTYPDQLDYWGVNAPAGNQTRVSSVAGTYTITVLPAHAAVSAGESNFIFFILKK